MITNSHISLSPDSVYRKDAINTLKYTLFLDCNIPKFNAEDQIKSIEAIIENCSKCCSDLFYDSKSISSLGPDFFGLILSNDNNASNDTWVKDILSMIPYHCVLSSYHSILTELLHGEALTAYLINDRIKTKGIHLLLKRKILTLTEESISFNKSSSNLPNSKKSSKASDFSKKAATHLNTMSSLKDLFSSASNEPDRYNLQFSSIFYRICSIPAPTWKNLSSSNPKLPKERLLKQVEKILIEMEPRISLPITAPANSFHDFYSDTVDGLYSYYITERIFNLNLFYSFLRYIELLQNKKEFFFYCQQKDIMKTLCYCKNLPNVFTRQYFLNYAFLMLDHKPISDYDYWSDSALDKAHTLMESTRTGRQEFDFQKWIQQYNLFVKYMYKFVFPVYEWCFISMFLTSIEEANRSKSHIEHLLIAMNCLTSFMERNYNSIIQPLNSLYNQNISDMLNITVDHKKAAVLSNLPDELIYLVKNEFFSFDNDKCSNLLSNNLELNLLHLCPDYFTKSKVSSETNYRRIRRFYLDLIRYTYLE